MRSHEHQQSHYPRLSAHSIGSFSNPLTLHNKPKLSPKQVQEIQTAEGTLREIADRYGVSHTTIGWIKRGFRKPRPPAPARTSYTSPVGVIVRERLTVPEFSRFSVDVRFTKADAAPIIAQIEEAISRHLDEAEKAYGPSVSKTHRRPYRKFEDGSVVFVFKTREARPPTPPKMVTVSGNKLRRPDLVRVGRRVSVTFEIVPWYRPDEIQEITGHVGALLSVSRILVFGARQPRK